MSNSRSRLATAFVVQLALITPSFGQGSRGAGSTDTLETEPCAPSGVPLLIRKEGHPPQVQSCQTVEDRKNTWDHYLDNGLKFLKVAPEENHGFFTLPDDFIAAWLPAPEEPEATDELERILQAKRAPAMRNAKEHAEAVARDYITDIVRNGPNRHGFLDAPDGFDARQYWTNNFTYVTREYPLLQPMERDHWKAPTKLNMLGWRWDENQTEIEIACIRHFYNFGLFDYTHHQDGDPRAEVAYSRPALHWYKMPKELNDWRKILELNPSMHTQMIAEIGEASDPEQAMWTFEHIFHAGSLNYRFNEAVPEGFDWEAYWRIVKGLKEADSLDQQDEPTTEKAKTDKGSTVASAGAGTPSIDEDEDPYHLDNLPFYPAVQTLEESHGKAQILKFALAIQEHCAMYASSLGLLFPLLPKTFSPMDYLKQPEVWQRYKKENSRSAHLSKRQKVAWAKADYFLNIFRFIKEEEDDEQVPLPQGFMIPADWNPTEHWDVEADVREDFEGDPMQDVKTVAFAQEALHQAWDAAGAEGEVAEEFAHFQPGLPEWYDTKAVLDENLNPGLADEIVAEVVAEKGPEAWEKASPGVKRMLVEAKTQKKFMEGDVRRTVAPAGFDAKQYAQANRKALKHDPQFKKAMRTRDPEARALELEHHYVTHGMVQGLPYTPIRQLPELPEWADEDHYFAQSEGLRVMGERLSRPAKRALMQQHFFTEGYEQELTLAPTPVRMPPRQEFDPEIYEAEARAVSRDLEDMLDKLKEGSHRARQALLHNHYENVGKQLNIRANEDYIFLARDMLPAKATRIGKIQSDGSLKVEAHQAKGLVTELEAANLPPGEYRLILELESSADEHEGIGEWEITAKERVHPLATLPLVSKPQHRFSFSGKLKLQPHDGPLQLKVRARNNTEFSVRRIIVRPVNPVGSRV